MTCFEDEVLLQPRTDPALPSFPSSSLLCTIILLFHFTDDPLMADIAQEFQGNYRKFEATAREWTEKYAGQVSLDFIQIQIGAMTDALYLWGASLFSTSHRCQIVSKFGIRKLNIYWQTKFLTWFLYVLINSWVCRVKVCQIGREPWSSGYGRRLMFRRLWVRIPVPYTRWTFFHIYLL